jgi:hypothetical protein
MPRPRSLLAQLFDGRASDQHIERLDKIENYLFGQSFELTTAATSFSLKKTLKDHRKSARKTIQTLIATNRT